MIRFRLGRNWKRERAAPPVDSFGLQLDGIELLAGANEESLERVVPAQVEACALLVTPGARFAQLSLPEASLELCMQRRDELVELSVVSLGRPAQLLRHQLRVELSEWVEATLACGHELLRDLAEARPAAPSPRIKQLARQLARLARAPVKPAPDPLAPAAEVHQLPSSGSPFGFSLQDPEGRLDGYRPAAHGGLGSLLVPGTVSLGAGATAWTGAGVPFLIALELSRQAPEVLHAWEADEPGVLLQPGGVGPALDLKLRPAEGARPLGIEPQRLVVAMYELGLSLAVAISVRSPLQAKNPYLMELVATCREGIAHARAPGATPEHGRAAQGPRRKPAQTRPLPGHGRLRRLRFDLAWEKSGLRGSEPGTLLLGPKGPIVTAPDRAFGFSRSGAPRFEHVGTAGVAAAAAGQVLVASDSRLLGFTAEVPGARWLRTHDGLVIGPLLLRKDGVLVTHSTAG